MSNDSAAPGASPETKTFPPGFIWGSATAAHQVEGNNFNSDCWATEHAKPSMFAEPSLEAADHWNRFSDDIALLAGMGLKAYRFSIEWARIEPQEGKFSSAALDHYQRCLDACHQRGITPIVTFHHFTNPLWVAQRGGMTSPDFPAMFANYCEHAMRTLKGIRIACTINELNVPVKVGDQLRAFLDTERGAVLKAAVERATGATFEASNFLFTPRALLIAHGLQAHALARDAIKRIDPDCQVGLTLAISEEEAEPGAEALRDQRNEELYGSFLDAVRGDDFVGVQNYTRMYSRPDGSCGVKPGHPTTMMGYEDRPAALAGACRYVWERIRTPILVTENGWAGEDDTRRAAFIPEAISHLHDAIQDGVDIRGYLYWSLLDNFEWFKGYGAKFGLIAVDRATQARSIKPSSLVLGEIARSNAVQATATTQVQDGALAPSGGGAPVGFVDAEA